MRLTDEDTHYFHRVLAGAQVGYGGQFSANSLVHHGLVRMRPTGRMAAAAILRRVPSDNELRLVNTLGSGLAVRKAVSWTDREDVPFYFEAAPSNVLRRFAEAGLAKLCEDDDRNYAATDACVSLQLQLQELDR